MNTSVKIQNSESENMKNAQKSGFYNNSISVAATAKNSFSVDTNCVSHSFKTKISS